MDLYYETVLNNFMEISEYMMIDWYTIVYFSGLSSLFWVMFQNLNKKSYSITTYTLFISRINCDITYKFITIHKNLEKDYMIYLEYLNQLEKDFNVTNVKHTIHTKTFRLNKFEYKQILNTNEHDIEIEKHSFDEYISEYCPENKLFEKINTICNTNNIQEYNFKNLLDCDFKISQFEYSDNRFVKRGIISV